MGVGVKKEERSRGRGGGEGFVFIFLPFYFSHFSSLLFLLSLIIWWLSLSPPLPLSLTLSFSLFPYFTPLPLPLFCSWRFSHELFSPFFLFWRPPMCSALSVILSSPNNNTLIKWLFALFGENFWISFFFFSIGYTYLIILISTFNVGEVRRSLGF